MSLKQLTTLLDLLGLLVLVAAVALGVWFWSGFAPAGLGVLGTGLLLVSWLIDRGKS